MNISEKICTDERPVISTFRRIFIRSFDFKHLFQVPDSIVVRTPGLHPGNPGSIPGRGGLLHRRTLA